MRLKQLFNQRVIVTSSIVLAMLMASIDTTILQTTMPIIAEELGHIELYAWTFTAYILASTALMPIAGRLADLFGRKRLFTVGIVVFLIGSLLCGMAMSLPQLVLFRAIQGIGAGVMMPLVQIIAGDLFEVKDRGKIQALFTSMWMISAIVAPILGAFFVQFTTWRWIFYINVPVSFVALGMLIPYKDVYESKKEPIDWLGAVLFITGTSTLLMVTVVETWQIVWAIAGLIILFLFVAHERRHIAPMIPGRLLKNKTLVWILINNLVVCTALFGLPNYIPLYLQEQGETILFSGIALLSMTAGWMALSVNSGRWIIRFGYRPLLLFSNTLLVMAALTLVLSYGQSGYVLLFIALVLLGGAFGLTFTVSIIGAQQLVSQHDKGISTSMQMFVRNTGLAIGVSIMGLAINRSVDATAGIQFIFIYGLIGSLIAMITAWFIRERPSRVNVIEAEAER